MRQGGNACSSTFFPLQLRTAFRLHHSREAVFLLHRRFWRRQPFTAMNFLDAPCKEEYIRLTEKSAVLAYQPDPSPRCHQRQLLSFHSHMIVSVIAGSCAIKNHKPRQVREEAAVVTLFMCMGVPGYPFFQESKGRGKYPLLRS